MKETENSNDSLLTIQRLMIWTAGVAFSLTAARLINSLGVKAWNLLVPFDPQTPGLETFAYLQAIVYGTCLSLFLIAVQTKNFWRSPGKIIMMIFTMICVFDWGLTVFANLMIVQHVSVIELPSPPGATTPMFGTDSDVSYVTNNGFVFGFYYQNLPGQIGYWLGIPVLLYVLFNSCEKSKLWKFGWLGFLCFTVLMLMEFKGWRAKLFNFPPGFAGYYFSIVIGIPIVAMVVAFLNDLIRRHGVDWWTTLTCTLLPIVWLAMIALQYFSI